MHVNPQPVVLPSVHDWYWYRGAWRPPPSHRAGRVALQVCRVQAHAGLADSPVGTGHVERSKEQTPPSGAASRLEPRHPGRWSPSAAPRRPGRRAASRGRRVWGRQRRVANPASQPSGARRTPFMRKRLLHPSVGQARRVLYQKMCECAHYQLARDRHGHLHGKLSRLLGGGGAAAGQCNGLIGFSSSLTSCL